MATITVMYPGQSIVEESERKLSIARQTLIQHQEHKHTTCKVCKQLIRAISKASSLACANRLRFVR